MKNKVIIGILFGVLLISNFRMYLLVNNMNEKVEDIEGIVRIINDSMDDVESDVYRSVNRLVEEKRWLYDIETEVKAVSEDLKNAKLAVSWSVRELDKGASMYLLYGVRDETSNEVAEWKEVSVPDSDDLSYRIELNVPFVNNYRFKVLARGDNRSISQELDEIDLLDKLEDRMDIDIDPNGKTSSGKHVKFSFDVDVYNIYDFRHIGQVNDGFNGNLLRIKNINLKVYSNDVLKKEIALYEDGKVVDNGDEVSYHKGPKHIRDMNVEEIEHSLTLEYDSVEDSDEVVEVIVEDYLGRTYTEKSRGM